MLRDASDKNVAWPLPENYTDAVLEGILFPEKLNEATQTQRRMPDFDYIRKELMRNGVNKKLLWTGSSTMPIKSISYL